MYDEAIRECKEAIKINKPNYAEPYHTLGLIYSAKGLYDDALREQKRAVKINPNYAEAYGSIGVIYLKKGRYDEAVLKFRKALELNGCEFVLFGHSPKPSTFKKMEVCGKSVGLLLG